MARKRTTQKLCKLYIVLLCNFLVPIFGDVSFTDSFAQATSSGMYVWNTQPGKNCINVDSPYFAEVHPSGSWAINPLEVTWSDTSVLNSYTAVQNVTVIITSYESSTSYFSPSPVVNLVDACGQPISYTPSVSPTTLSANTITRHYSFQFSPKLTADSFKGAFKVNVIPQVSPSSSSSGTWAAQCIRIFFGAENATASGSCSGSGGSSPPVSPSVTPSLSSPSATPSPSRSPSPSPSISASPSPSPSLYSSVTPSNSPSIFNGGSVSPSPSYNANQKSGKGDSNTGMVAGVIVGALVGVGLLAGIAFLLVTKRKRKQREEAANPNHLESNSSEAAIALKPTPTSPSSGYYSEPPRDSHSSVSKSGLSSELYINDVKLKGLLGKGKFGEVYEGLWHGTTAVACKKLKKDDKEEFENEIMLLMKLNHPNVVRCLGIWNNPSNGEIFMILELLRLGSLTNFLRSPEAQKKLAVADLIEMCVHAASGMVFLEQKNIVHRDLGARNLLVTESDGRYVVKISDFGLSRQVEENDAVYSSKEGVFPVKWSPPEVINFRKFTSKSDVWSYGITMWEIFELGKVPYPTLTNDESVAKVMKGYRMPKPDTCPDDVYKLMLQCWSTNPDERPNFKSIHEQLQQVLSHIRGEDEEFKYTAEDADKNYQYNNNNYNKPDTYNTGPTEMYNNRN